MLVEIAEILILRADELLSKQLPRMLPGSAFLGEDAISQQRCKDGRTTAKTIVLEVGRKERFDVCRVQDVVCPRPDEQILAQVVTWFVVLGYGAQEG